MNINERREEEINLADPQMAASVTIWNLIIPSNISKTLERGRVGATQLWLIAAMGAACSRSDNKCRALLMMQKTALIVTHTQALPGSLTSSRGHSKRSTAAMTSPAIRQKKKYMPVASSSWWFWLTKAHVCRFPDGVILVPMGEIFSFWQDLTLVQCECALLCVFLPPNFLCSLQRVKEQWIYCKKKKKNRTVLCWCELSCRTEGKLRCSCVAGVNEPPGYKQQN